MTLREQRLAAVVAVTAIFLFVALIVSLKVSDVREREFIREMNANAAEGLSALGEPELRQMREKLPMTNTRQPLLTRRLVSMPPAD